MKCLSKQVTQNDGRPELVGSVVKPRPNVAVFVGRTGLAHVTHIDTNTNTDRDIYMCPCQAVAYQNYMHVFFIVF